MKGSVHSKQGITCNQCHGGDPSQADQAAAKKEGTGYIGIPDKQKIAEICGNCHANVETMNFYGIRTDQLARYKTSMHGKKLFGENNTQVAVCSDCHGYHDVVAISDPTSPVYPLNIPKTCNHCHGNEKIMGHYNLPTDIFDKYQKSVHGVALFEKKDLSVANCASCHGSHGAVPPGVKEISATCGKCHINEKKYFSQSVHAKAMKAGKFSECVSCHSNHDVHRAGPVLYQEACVKCHDANSNAYRYGQNISHALQDTEKQLKEAGELVRQASIEGFFVEEEQALLEEAKTGLLEMAPLQHTLSFEKISQIYADTSKKLEDVRKSIFEKRQNLRWRKLALIPIWIFILIMVVALRIRYNELKSLDDKKKREGKSGSI